MKKLVIYFSAQGRTKKMAEKIASEQGADMVEILPKVPYKKEDLNWMNSSSRTSVEMNDPSSRPEMEDVKCNIGDYDEIYLGFPIWWYTAPHIIHTFLEKYDFSGKTIKVFATSGSSGFGSTVRALQNSAPKAKISEYSINGKLC